MPGQQKWPSTTISNRMVLETRKIKKTNIFPPSQWTVHYAPPGSEVTGCHLKKPRPAWKTLALWLRLAVTYSMYMSLLMAAPGSHCPWLHLYEESENDGGSIFWKRFVLPNYLSQLCLSSLRSICYLNVVLYLIRMLAMKPLPLLLGRQISQRRFPLGVYFLPGPRKLRRLLYHRQHDECDIDESFADGFHLLLYLQVVYLPVRSRSDNLQENV
uniref:Uncharacterized protein n=1 Tax=Daphnia galeata TaxID=27404 RepID=A0A8J2RT60_9CRUS|nr:unnamed protein product [Daphnia galeata]